MRIDATILRAALTHPRACPPDRATDELNRREGRLRFPSSWVPASDDFLSWAHDHGVCDDLIALFRQAWPDQDTLISDWTRFWSPSTIRAENDAYPQLRQEGFLLIGSSLSGDWIALDVQVNEGVVGYLGREHVARDAVEVDGVWRYVLEDTVRPLFVPLATSIGAFALAAVKDAIPIDAFGTWSESNESGRWTLDDF